jgi:hypothetical protein
MSRRGATALVVAMYALAGALFAAAATVRATRGDGSAVFYAALAVVNIGLAANVSYWRSGAQA